MLSATGLLQSIIPSSHPTFSQIRIMHASSACSRFRHVLSVCAGNCSHRQRVGFIRHCALDSAPAQGAGSCITEEAAPPGHLLWLPGARHSLGRSRRCSAMVTIDTCVTRWCTWEGCMRLKTSGKGCKMLSFQTSPVISSVISASHPLLKRQTAI